MAFKSFKAITAQLLAVTLTASGLVGISSSRAKANVSVDVQVAIGQQHVVALGSNGTVWTWGSLIPGPTGVGSKDALNRPTQVVLAGGRTGVDVAATYNASFALASDGTVWGWGSLGRGLGDSSASTDVRYTSPVRVIFPSGVQIAELSAACEGVLARSSTGDVYQWGSFYGNWQMSFDAPTKLAGVSEAISISRGCTTSFAILANGSAMAWGSNGGGRIGDGTTTDRTTPVVINLPNGKRFSKISSSSSHALAVSTDGTLFGWGGNSNGQLGADPNSLAYQTTPRLISLGSASARDVSTSDSTPFSTVVTSLNTVLKWGGWGTSEYIPSSINLPNADFASRNLRSVVSYQNASVFTADDNSIWARGWWWNVDLDGNCGANPSDYATWRDGVTIPSRSVVRTTSNGQFGATFSEDQLSITKMESGSGANLPLDGSGTITGTVGEQTSVVLTSPRSSCFDVDQIDYELSQDNGVTWTSSGVSISTNNFAQTIVTVSFTPNTSGRRRAFVRLVNPDGQTQSFRFNLGVAAAPTNSAPINAATLPVVETALNTSLAIGTDGFLYAWGASRHITGESTVVREPKRIIPSAAEPISPPTTTIPSSTTTSTTTTVPLASSTEFVATTTTTTSTIPPTTTVPMTTTVPPTTTTSSAPASTTVAPTPVTTTTSSAPASTTVAPTPSTTTTIAPTTPSTTVPPAMTSEDMSTLKFRSIAMIADSNEGINIVAAAVAEDGRLFVWGKSSGADLILGSSTEITQPRALAVSQNRRATSVHLVSSWSSLCNPTCTSGNLFFGFVLDESGSVLAWGGGAPLTNSYLYTARYGMQPSIVSALVGSEYESMKYSRIGGILTGVFLLRTAAGEVYRWHPTSGSSTHTCSATCSYTFNGASPVLVGSFSANFSDGYLYSSTSRYGIVDIDSNQDVVFSALDQQGNIASTETIDLPNNRQAKQVVNSLVLATDGTIWDFSYLRYGIRQRNIPLSMRPVSRFASRSTDYVIGGVGHLYAYSGAPSGACAAPLTFDRYSSEEGGFRVSSDGQFGPAFSEDSFMLALDSPSERNFLLGEWTWGRTPRLTFGSSGRIEALNVRPGSSVDLYAYFDSSCEESNNLNIAWDLDDDGIFESTGNVEPVETSRTQVTTNRPLNPETEDGEYTGLESTYRQSKIVVTSSSPGGALVQAGGRYISVKVSSQSGSVEQRIPIIVVPAKPSGRVGITINSSARFTDSNEVELSVVWPEGMTSMIVANDGSFADAREIPLTSRTRWNLPTGGTGLLPTTVYVRFVSIWPNLGGWDKSESEWNYTDDIVLDLSPPVVSSISATSTSNAVLQVRNIAPNESLVYGASFTQSAVVSMTALDTASGVSAVQVSDDTAVPGPERAYSTQIRLPVSRGTVAVRAKDNVGHWSAWKYARVTGFVPSPEVPSAPPIETPIAPSAPVVVDAPTPAPKLAPVTPQAPSVESSPVVVASPSPAISRSNPTATSATASLVGKNAKVSISIPAAQSKTCKTSVVKGKKVSTCKAVPIVVSVSGGPSRTITAKSGTNALSLPAKKGQTITVKVNGKVVKKIKL